MSASLQAVREGGGDGWRQGRKSSWIRQRKRAYAAAATEVCLFASDTIRSQLIYANLAAFSAAGRSATRPADASKVRAPHIATGARRGSGNKGDAALRPVLVVGHFVLIAIQRFLPPR